MSPNAPPPWRVGRIILAVALVLTGAAGILTTVAFLFWPADIILVSAAMLICGIFFVRIEPRPPRELTDRDDYR